MIIIWPGPCAGMVERVAKLEKELEDRNIVKGEDRHEAPLYESSSDAGIESGTEEVDCLSEKWSGLVRPVIEYIDLNGGNLSVTMDRDSNK